MSMILPPLEMISCYFMDVTVKASDVSDIKAPLSSDEPVPHNKVSFRVQSGKSAKPDSENKWVAILKVVCRDVEEPDRALPYEVELTVVGTFLVRKEVEETKKEEMIAKSGGAILYSSAREFVAQMTGRMAHGPFFLPTVSFLGLEKKNGGSQ